MFTETVTDHRDEEGRARDFRGDHERIAHTTTRRIPVENLRRVSKLLSFYSKISFKNIFT